MVEKDTSKKNKVSKDNIESSDDKIALTIMSFIVDILFSISVHISGGRLVCIIYLR